MAAGILLTQWYSQRSLKYMGCWEYAKTSLVVQCRCKGHRFETWSRKIPHPMEQLSLWATTTEPTHIEPVLRNKRGYCSEKTKHCSEAQKEYVLLTEKKPFQNKICYQYFKRHMYVWGGVKKHSDFPYICRGVGHGLGEGNGNPLQYSCLENPMDGGDW